MTETDDDFVHALPADQWEWCWCPCHGWWKGVA